MTALEKYIQELKIEISKLKLDEIETIRYIYINLGKKMNFDLNYTFGNRKHKKMIYNKEVNETELNKVFDLHTVICRSLAYLLERILKDFNINIRTIETEMYTNKIKGKHIYNLVKLKDGKDYIIDLEEDLEFIQSGAKTQYFGINPKSNKLEMLTEEKLRNIDIKSVGYIPEGYYFEDMIWMLKKAISSKYISLEQKLEFVLDNLNVYTNNKKAGYRERIMYYSKLIEEVFTEKERHRIHQLDFVKKKKENVICKNVIILDVKNKKEKVFIYESENNRYTQKSMKEVVDLLDNDYKTKQGIPGLKSYLSKMNKIEENER